MKRILVLVVLAGLFVFFGSLTSQAAEKKTDLERVKAIMAKNKLLPEPELDLRKEGDIAKSFRLPGEKMIVIGGKFDENNNLFGIFALFDASYQPDNQITHLFTELLECGTGISRYNSSLLAMTRSVITNTKTFGEFHCGSIQGITLPIVKNDKKLVLITFDF